MQIDTFLMSLLIFTLCYWAVLTLYFMVTNRASQTRDGE